jgi:hypothetical protein
MARRVKGGNSIPIPRAARSLLARDPHADAGFICQQAEAENLL